MKGSRWTLAVVATASALGACGGRPSYWDQPVNPPTPTYGLANAVVVIDDPAHRAVVLTAGSDQQLHRTFLPVGHNFASAVASPDGKTLFVLSAGDWPRQPGRDELPSLTVITVDSTSLAASERQFTMAEPHSNLAVDPRGEYVVAYHGPNPTQANAATRFAENPNEIVVFNLKATGSAKPVPYTLRSSGGTPQRLSFTDPINLPVGAATAPPRRLLLVETSFDLKILDLSHFFDPGPPMPGQEITVPLTTGMTAQQLAPAGLAVDVDDGVIAVRTTTDSNVYTLTLLPSGSAAAANDFNPLINLVDVGGLPSDVAFVNTDSGKRVAALVPSRSEAVIFDLAHGLTTHIALPSDYSKLSLVTTNTVRTQCSGSATPTPDVALLWGSGRGASGVALWTLGVSVCTPYRSVDVLSIADSIQSVDDVPKNNLKILQATPGTGGAFYVLNLLRRTAAPIITTSTPTIAIAPDGRRVWAFARGGTDLTSTDLTTLSPIPVTTSLPISAVYDIATGPGIARALVAIHEQGTLGATVFDALAPDTTTARRVSSILLEGP
jgi:hypothetical protein